MAMSENQNPFEPVKEKPKPVKQAKRLAPMVRRSRWADGGPSSYERGPKTFGPFKQVRD
jgi:hypothetical protein